MNVSQNAIDLIKHYEGFSSKPYYCPAGISTIGYGHVLRKDENFQFITEEDAEAILKQDCSWAEQAVIALTSIPLNQNQFDALVSFVFNLGSGSYQASTLRRKLNRGDAKGAADEFKRWVYAGGIKLKGLVVRRKAEQELFLKEQVISDSTY